MSKYDFSTLNDQDFEDIVCDLLTAEHGITYQSFKPGRDKGIDLRYSTKDNENHTVVQVKHYLNSGVSALKSTLKNKEFRKAQNLKVEKYIVVTSIGLSPSNKHDIKSYFEPYIQSTNDIYGKNELNTLLGKHKHVEKQHFKLWFTNTRVIERIINQGIHGRSDFSAEKISAQIGLFVKTKSYDKAFEVLQKEKILLITGLPGVGKTTLSYLILYRLIGEGFEIVECYKDFYEGESILVNDKSKQVFFFDDFLGDTYVDVIQGKNKKINNFIERIRTYDNKYVILTTRISILSQAIYKHEILSRANFHAQRFELKLSEFKEREKAQIFYNHLYFSALDKHLIQTIIEDKNYNKIINHSSYNPRLLEHITDLKKFEHSEFDNYLNFCLYNLNHPERLWEHPFREQLIKSERNLLFALLSLGGTFSLHKLEEVYEETYSTDDNHEPFNDVYKKLLNGYVSAEKRSDDTIVKFINPSLKDYLIDYLKSQNGPRNQFIKNFIFIEQFDALINPFDGLKYSKKDWLTIFEKIKSENIGTLEGLNFSELMYQKAVLLISSLHEIEDETGISEYDLFTYQLLSKINWNEVESIKISDLEWFLESSYSKTKSYMFVSQNLHIFLRVIFSKIYDFGDLDSLFDLEKRKGFDINSLLEKSELEKDYLAMLEEVYKNEDEAHYYSVYKSIYSEQDYENALDEVERLRTRISDYTDKLDSLDIFYSKVEDEGLGLIQSATNAREFNFNDIQQNELIERQIEIDELFERLNYK